MNNYSTSVKYQITAKCLTPLHIGDSSTGNENILLHEENGLPFIQASSLAGIMRSRYEAHNGTEAADLLFGKKDGSLLTICDGEFKASTVKVEYRPRVAINPETGTVSSTEIMGSGHTAGHKFSMKSVAAGAEFTFQVYLKSDDKQLETSFEELCCEFASGMIQIGGQKSNGHGFVCFTEVKKKTYDFTTEEGRKAWIRESDTEEYDGVLDLSASIEDDARAYTIYVDGSMESTVLVKGISADSYTAGAADVLNLRNADGNYIIPGSSVKGAVRSRMERIAVSTGTENYIEDAFGFKGGDGETGTAGCLIFRDIVLSEAQEQTSHRIHIDKFTGGVIDGSLFTEESVSGELGDLVSASMEIDVVKRNNQDAACGLLLFALRDLAVKMFNFGSGYAIGRGFVNIRSITVKDGTGAEAVISFADGTTQDETGIISRCLKALRKEN